MIALSFGDRRNPAHADAEMIALKALPQLIKCLDDSHYWVRVWATVAIGKLGEKAVAALPKVTAGIQDKHEWVRIASIRTVKEMSKNPEILVNAALRALQTSNTSYGVSSRAIHILTEHPGEKADRLDAYLRLLNDIPEGGGGRILTQTIEKVAVLDPAGEKLIPVLIDAVSRKLPYHLQRGNPLGKSIDQLAAYGPKAQAALPALEALLAREDKRSKGYHEQVKKAIAAIKGEKLPAVEDQQE